MFVLQGEFDRRDFLICTLGKIGNGAVLNLAILAIGFAQQNTCIDLIGSTRNRELSFLTNFALPVAKQPASVMRLIWFTASSFSYVFVEPGVKQLLTYVTIIPENIRFILVHAQFTYLNHDPHGAEKNPIQIGV